MCWHTHYHTLGSGHLYQGRFKSFPVAADAHFYAAVGDVNAMPSCANLVQRAENLALVEFVAATALRNPTDIALADWPLPMPADWLETGQSPRNRGELTALRQSVNRGAPLWRAGLAGADGAAL